MTQVELALAAGVQEDTIASIEQGRRSLVPDLAETIDDLLDTSGRVVDGGRQHAGIRPDSAVGRAPPQHGARGAGALLVRQPGHPGPAPDEGVRGSGVQQQDPGLQPGGDRDADDDAAATPADPGPEEAADDQHGDLGAGADDETDVGRRPPGTAPPPLRDGPTPGRLPAGASAGQPGPRESGRPLHPPGNTGPPARRLHRDPARQPPDLDRTRSASSPRNMRCCEPRRSPRWRPCACWPVYWERHEHRTELVQVELQRQRRRPVPRSRLRLAEVELQRQ